MNKKIVFKYFKINFCSKGQLEVDRNFKVLTLCSRVGSIWGSVAQSRAKFESIPDKGLIGKTVRVYLYLFIY